MVADPNESHRRCHVVAMGMKAERLGRMRQWFEGSKPAGLAVHIPCSDVETWLRREVRAVHLESSC